MRKIWLLIAVLTVISCKTETPVDYAIVSGTIENKVGGEITITGLDRSLKSTIKLAEDGSFVDTLTVEEGIYHLMNGRIGTKVFLHSGANLNIKFDTKDVKNSLTFVGSEMSKYLFEKGNKEIEVIGGGTAVYELDEEAYKAKYNELRIVNNELLNSYKNISEAYKTKELRNLDYAYFYKLSIYGNYHAHYAKKPDFVTSEGFLSELAELDYLNEEDFGYSQDYERLVTANNYKEAVKLAENESIEEDIAVLKVASTIENETIKNKVLFENAKYNITYTDDVEGFYAEFMAAATDQDNIALITESYNKLRTVAKGQPSPKFVGYENFDGGTTSLDDLKGKYVYVDVWATWCGPCKREIPFLKEVEKKYHGKNIEFVSISVDKAKDHEKWKNMVDEKELKGIQLFADKDWSSDFVAGYLIKGIPRFILIDPEGNIVTANADRPSNPELITLFDELGI